MDPLFPYRKLRTTAYWTAGSVLVLLITILVCFLTSLPKPTIVFPAVAVVLFFLRLLFAFEYVEKELSKWTPSKTPDSE
jgi:hypothetical protein